ncbi:hypothetical protein LWP59_28460 [Amycolatopsis acidiphila]|uniref:hypothetical protein n=1 Tax=Amycolatopsis acidiphila TaxID=715473 RepID=UPI001F2CD338|nr:hypothetical protein [Amycolatopsis acidiphila]UIJ58036.1 hypothetical protein LWP59_28460 [Amycolatopsis acidiphila]
MGTGLDLGWGRRGDRMPVASMVPGLSEVDFPGPAGLAVRTAGGDGLPAGAGGR